MKKKYQNLFFIFGVIVLAVMLTQLDYREVWQGLTNTGYWFFAVLGLWAVLYLFNTATWYIIIRSGNGGKAGVGFSWFIFWLLSILIYLLTERLNLFVGLILAAAGAFCALGVWFFLKGYRKGMAVRLMNFVRHIPGLKKWAGGFVDKHKEQLGAIDRQIASLHNQNPKTFVSAVLLELACRFCSAFEIMFIMFVLPDVHATFLQSVLIIAFTSLFANLLFFIPLQLGGREGGFVMSTAGLSLSAGAGIFVALIVRIRELIWTAIGLLLINLEKKRK